MNWPINPLEIVGDPVYGKGLTIETATQRADPLGGYMVSVHQRGNSPQTRTPESVRIDTGSKLAFLCSLPDNTKVVRENDGTVQYCVPANQ